MKASVDSIERQMSIGSMGRRQPRQSVRFNVHHLIGNPPLQFHGCSSFWLVLVNALVGGHVCHRRHVPDRKSRSFTSTSIPHFTNHISTTCIHGKRMSTARTTQLCHDMSRRTKMQSLNPRHLPSRPTNPERCRHPQRSHPSDLFKPSINATPPQRTSRPFSKLLKHAGHWHWNGQLIAVVVVKNTRSMLICIARRGYRQGATEAALLDDEAPSEGSCLASSLPATNPIDAPW